MIRTLRDFLEEVGGLSYDNGDFWAVRDKFRDREIQAFVDCFLPGTQILRDGKNGAPVAMKGLAYDNKGDTGEEELAFHGLQLYDFSDTTGEWVVVPFPDLESLEKSIERQANFSGRGMFRSFFESDYEFHRRIFEIAEQLLSWETIANVNCHYDRMRMLIMSEQTAQTGDRGAPADCRCYAGTGRSDD